MGVKDLHGFVRTASIRTIEHRIGEEELTSDSVVRAVSAVQGLNPSSNEPLAGVVETDALDAVFSDRRDGTPRTGGHLSFIYGGCRVTVDNGEYLTVEAVERLRGSGPTGSGSDQRD